MLTATPRRAPRDEEWECGHPQHREKGSARELLEKWAAAGKKNSTPSRVWRGEAKAEAAPGGMEGLTCLLRTLDLFFQNKGRPMLSTKFQIVNIFGFWAIWSLLRTPLHCSSRKAIRDNA